MHLVHDDAIPVDFIIGRDLLNETEIIININYLTIQKLKGGVANLLSSSLAEKEDITVSEEIKMIIDEMYIDDLIILSEIFAESIRKIGKVLATAKEFGLVIK